MILDIIVIIFFFIFIIFYYKKGSLFRKYSFLYYVDLVFDILLFILIDVIFYGGSFIEEPKNSNPAKKEPEKKIIKK
jgi:hypothetical protein